MMKEIDKKHFIIGIIFLSYFIFDIIHFFIFRMAPDYPLFSNYYENKVLSFLKWSFCIMVLISIGLNIQNNKYSFYLIIISSIGIIMLFIFKGRWNNLLMGSLVQKIGLLEIGAILIIILLVNKYRIKYKINPFITLSVSIVISILFYFAIQNISII